MRLIVGVLSLLAVAAIVLAVARTQWSAVGRAPAAADAGPASTVSEGAQQSPQQVPQRVADEVRRSLQQAPRRAGDAE
jgi:hypothetical protein